MCSEKQNLDVPTQMWVFPKSLLTFFFYWKVSYESLRTFSIVLKSRRNVNVRFLWLIESFKMWLNLVAIILLGNSSIGRYNNSIIVPNVNKILPTCTCIGINCKSCSNIQTRIASKETFSEKTVGNNFVWA